MARYVDPDERFAEPDSFTPVSEQAPIAAVQAARAVADQNVSDVVTPPTISATQNNYSLGEGKKFRLSTSGGARIITGLANVQPGREVILVNLGPNNITLNNDDAGSDAANRILTGSGAAIVIVPDGSASLFYDNVSLRWRKIPTV